MGEVTAQDIADALHTTPSLAVQRAKEWGDELHKLRGRLVSWASGYRLLAMACDPDRRLDLETPFDAKRSNAIQNKATAVIDAAAACGWDSTNPDTCGVCHRHFDECEKEWHQTIDRSEKVVERPDCPGARVRLAMQKSL